MARLNAHNAGLFTTPNAMNYTQTSAAPSSNFRQARLLVVEDNPDHWTLIQAAMGQVLPEVEVVWAANSEQAMAHLRTNLQTNKLPKLLLLDLYLPDAEQSWQLLRALKARNSPYLRIPVVVFSHSDRRDDISDFYAFGGTSYIVKPETYDHWITYLQSMRLYWWETVTLP